MAKVCNWLGSGVPASRLGSVTPTSSGISAAGLGLGSGNGFSVVFFQNRMGDRVFPASLFLVGRRHGSWLGIGPSARAPPSRLSSDFSRIPFWLISCPRGRRPKMDRESWYSFIKSVNIRFWWKPEICFFRVDHIRFGLNRDDGMKPRLTVLMFGIFQNLLRIGVSSRLQSWYFRMQVCF